MFDGTKNIMKDKVIGRTAYNRTKSDPKLHVDLVETREDLSLKLIAAKPAGWAGDGGRSGDGSHMCAWTPDIVLAGESAVARSDRDVLRGSELLRVRGREGDKSIRCLFTLREDI